ncbi:MAG: DNA polymerase III subunit gamma/tau [Anaerolineae bacterium]
MAAQALYRRWRPQTFEDVVGQTHIIQTLRNALAAGRIAHAYLFAGPRGTGKTTIARILARAVNCTAPSPDERPCGVCHACRSLAEGRSLDLIEIDAASHTSVDNVRDLIEKVQFAPTETRYKVYIIDEVHMLSTSAFNALLKTLEEPPPHALFFLATTESHKIPATILSRCQRFSFYRIPLGEMIEHLSHICEVEHFQVEPAALEAIARYAQGGLRDAISLLDQMVAFGGETVTLAQVQAVLGTAADAAVEVLADHIAARDSSSALRVVNQAIDGGVDPRQLTAQLLEYLRGLLLIQHGSAALLNVTPEALERMEAQARRIPPAALVRAIRVFGDAAQAQRGGLQPQLPLELAVVEAVLDLSHAPAASAPPAPSVREAPPAPARPSAAPPSAVAAPPPSSGPVPDQPSEPSPSPAAPEIASELAAEPMVAADVERPAAEAGSYLAELLGQWEHVIAILHQQNRQLAALMKDCYPLDASEDSVTIGVYYPFHHKRLEEPKQRGLLEKTLSDTLGRKIRLVCKLTPKSKEEIAAERTKNPLEQVADDPVVKEAIKMGGKITGISLD